MQRGEPCDVLYVAVADFKLTLGDSQDLPNLQGVAPLSIDPTELVDTGAI